MYYSSISQLFVLGTGILSATIVTAQQQNSTTQPDNAPSNPQVQITSPNDFCLFLPPQPGADVATTEDDGIAFCMNPATVQGSQVFPQGFITAAHYQQTESYTQITGFFDRTKYNLSPDDFGGQYDSHAKHKPTGASCQNFPYFVSLIEPSNNRFCIRCCNDTEDCKTGISQRGCARVISPGNYDDNNQFDSVPPQDSASGSSASASAGPTASASASSGSQPSASGSSSAPPPAGQSDVPIDGQTPSSSSDSSSSFPPPAADQTGAPADGTKTEGGNDVPGDGDSQQIPNTSYNSVLDDLNSSSSSGRDVDSNGGDSQGKYIKSVDEEASYIQTHLASPQVDLDALKTQFSTFTANLSNEFPDAATKIKQLADIISGYKSANQWKHLATVLQQKAPGAFVSAEN